MDDTKTANDGPAEAETVDLKRKTKLETYLHSGCGYSRSKRALLESFWSIIWPGLERIGWTKIVGTGLQLGSITFVPPDGNPDGKRDRDYYDRIRALIDRIEQRRNEMESRIEENFRGEFEKRLKEYGVKKSSPPVKQHGTRHRGRPRFQRSGRIDLSWKNSGNIYPKRTSRVGFGYQALSLPLAGTFKKPATDEECSIQLWDPVRGECKEVMDFLDEKVPPSKKEEALAVIHRNGYSVSGIEKMIDDIKPMDGSDWSEEKKDLYHREIFRLRKDMNALSQSANIEMKSCLAYYLGTFKKSDHYRLLKTVCIEEKEKKTASQKHDHDACAVCGDGGSLLICDGCEGEYHIGCLRPALRIIPEGHWECDECVNRKLLESRDALMQQTRLFEKSEPTQGKRMEGSDDGRMGSGDENDGTSNDRAFMLKASPFALDLVRDFAKGVTESLSSM